MTSYAIVGGGILGISMAMDLREQGHDVTLIEGAPILGGLADAWTIGDLRWDRHYHVVLASDANTRAFLDRLSLTDDLNFVETKTGCYADGQLHSVSNAIELLRFPGLNLIDTVRLGATVAYVSQLKDWRRLERIPVSDWLIRLSGQRTFDRFWLPLLRSKLGDNVQHASAAFMWAIIQRLYAARRSGLKTEQFGYVSGGYGRVMDRAIEALDSAGITVTLGHRVASISSDPVSGGVRIVGHNNQDQSDGPPPIVHHADRVIVTTAAPVTARIVPDLDADEFERLTRVRYQGIICASLVLRRGLSPFYVTNITDTGLPFTGVIEMSALVPTEELAGHHLVYLPRYTTSTDEALSWTDEEIERQFVGGLKQMHPDLTDDDIVACRISRVPFVVPISELGYSTRVPSMTTSIPGVYVVNGSQILNGTLNVDETLALGHRALKIIADDDRRPHPTSPSFKAPSS